MKNILITGCNGLIGDALVERLLKTNSYNLFGIGRSSKDRIKTFHIDFSTDWNVKQLPPEMDIIIHLAQSEKFRNFPHDADEVFNVNTVSTLKLLEYARMVGVKKFIYASTGAVYGSVKNEMTEGIKIEAVGNLGFYHTSKICSEIILDNYSSLMDIITLRFFFAYGPNQTKTMLIPRLVKSVMDGAAIQLQGETGIKINPIYMDDAAAGIEKALALTGSHKINIAGPEVLSLRQIGEIIGRLLGKSVAFQIDKDATPHNYIGDIRKMSTVLVAPTITVEEGIKQFLNANGNHLIK